MRKILRLSLVAMFALVCSTAFAQEVSLDFTTNGWGLPEDSKNKATASASFTNGTYTITLAAADGYYFNTQGYLMLGKSGSTLTLPAFSFDVEKIEVVGNGGASTSVKQNIYVGDVAVSTETTGAGTSDKAAITNTYEIASDYQAAGNVYVLKVTSKQNTQITKINIYKKNGVSKKSANLAFSESKIELESGVDKFTAPTFTKETTATVSFSSDNEGVATVSADGVIALGTELGTAVITATAEANDEYNAGTATCTIDVAEYNHYVKATTAESGKAYLLGAVLTDGTAFYAYPIGTSKTYGYLSGSTSKSADDIKVKKSYDDTFVFTSETEGWTIKQNSDNRYLYQTGTYNSFNVAAEPTEGQYWTITANSDGTQTITNIAMSKYIQYSPSYTSFGSYSSAQSNAILPTLYVLKETTGISSATAKTLDTNAPVYNLAGQRVGKNAKGILIQNGRKFIRK